MHWGNNMLNTIIKLKKYLEKGLELTVILVTGFLVLDVVWGVATRYLLGHQSPWTEELARFLLVWVGLMGASLGFIRKSHLGVDYFVGKLSPKGQTIIQLIVYICVSFFSSVVMIYGGYRLVAMAFEYPQRSAALNIQMGYIYLAVPISGFFIFIFSVETIIETIGLIYNKNYDVN